MTITEQQRIRIAAWLESEVAGWISLLSREERQNSWDHCYPGWVKGGRGYDCLHQGGTGIMRLRIWYCCKHKPGSKEWRPAIIIKAAMNHLRINSEN